MTEIKGFKKLKCIMNTYPLCSLTINIAEIKWDSALLTKSI